MIRWVIVSLLLFGLYISIVWSGISVSQNAISFLADEVSYNNFANQIPPQIMNSYMRFLGVNNLRFATINLPSANNQNTTYPFNLSNNSLLRVAEARINNNVLTNAWEINRDSNNNYILTFARIINDIGFQELELNLGGNYIANICWDPNLSGSVARGITPRGDIYKIYKDGDNLIAEQKYSSNLNRMAVSSVIGDFNNDGRADLFVIRANNNTISRGIIEAAIFVQGNNETFSKIVINTDSWYSSRNQNNNPDEIKLDIKWTAHSIVSTYQKYDNNLQKYIIERFDYNNDGKQDIIIASTDGAVYVIPNQSSSNTISFGNPVKVVTTGLSISDQGAQVISAGDINKDGIVDILVGTTNNSRLYIYYGKKDNQGKIYFGGNNPNIQSSPDIILYDFELTNNNNKTKKIVIRSNAVETSEYRGPNTQKTLKVMLLRFQNIQGQQTV
ncbi:MAG: VCBS repeat-containing protein [bacterium]